MTRHTFHSYMVAVRLQVHQDLERGTGCAQSNTAATCRELLQVEPALWTFVEREGVEPTNNAAEQALRQGVLWRKSSFGTQSETGSRFVERILTGVTTLRQQKRDELMQLLSTARRTDRKVMICHVLRYAPFYVEIRRRVAAGEIGDLVSIRTVENVSYHHMAVGFVRGKWRRTEDSNPMLLAKCCHDLDILSWMHSGVQPLRVSSFGNLQYFRPEKARAGSGTRCLVDCLIEADCPYSARKNYIDQGRWGFYAWDSLEHIVEPTVEQKLDSLRGDNPYGRCVWRCDNDVVDHQSVIVEFADGCLASHDMVGNTARPCRTIHLVGTRGEIEGNMEEGKFAFRHPDARAGHEYGEEWVDLNVTGDMHGGGDLRLVGDFVRIVRGEQPSLSTTDLIDSVNGHMIAFAADESMTAHRVVEIALSE